MTIYDHNTPFYDQIIEEPESDEARLIFADWLEEQGDFNRAEFIRVQCSVEHVPFWKPEWSELKAREKELWQANQQQWTEGINLKTINYRFRRGFVDRVILSRGMTINSVKKMVELFPTIQSLKLKTQKDLEQFGTLPWFGRLRQLNLACTGIKQPELEKVITKSNLQQLTSLNLHANTIGGSGASMIMDVDVMPNLKKLSLSSTALNSSRVAKRIFNSPKFRQLDWLDIAGNWTMDAASGINSVFDKQPSSNLEFLEMGWGTSAAGSLQPFIRSEAFKTIKHLNINMPLQDNDVEYICNQPSQIETLSLTDASEAQVRMLATRSPIWESLKVLNIPCRSNRLPQLLCSDQFGQLQCLYSHSLDNPAIRTIEQELGIKVNDSNFKKRPQPF